MPAATRCLRPWRSTCRAGVTHTHPEGGFFVWLTLPEGIDTYALLQEGVKAGVIFIPGAAFSPSGAADNKLRLAFCSVDEKTIDEGVKRLADLLTNEDLQALGRWLVPGTHTSLYRRPLAAFPCPFQTAG